MQLFSSFNSLVKQAAASIAELAAPKTCLMCDEPLAERAHRISTVCNACMDSLPAAPSPDELQLKLTQCFDRDEIAVSQCFALTIYAATLPFSRVIRALKYEQISSVGIEMGREIGSAMRHLDMEPPDLIIPVPIHHARKRERSYNQADLIGRGIAETIRIPVVSNALIRRRYTITQTRMNAAQRLANLSEAFVAGKNSSQARDKIALLADDVFTTGSTINACATALLEAGAKRVNVAVIAATSQDS